jgi:lipopolysaccharide export system ATP-binding protein
VDDDFWQIGLNSLGGLIPEIQGESMSLGPARPRRRVSPAPWSGRADPQVQRSQPTAAWAESQETRPEPPALRPAPQTQRQQSAAPRAESRLLRTEPQTLRPEPQMQRPAAPWAESQASWPEPQTLRPEPQVQRTQPAAPWAESQVLRPDPRTLRPEPQVLREPAGPRSRPQAGRREQPSGPPDGLSAHGLSKSFSGRKVVNNVSIHVRRGEAVGLLGPNGAGKTTVFYMITGLIRADRGRIDLDGQDVTRLPMYQRARLGVGYLPQEASIFRGLNVEDNIRAVLEATEPDRRRRETDLGALLEEFGIAPLRKTPSIALSGGERRRVEIARALASRPSYMLLDEPFAGIDPKAVVEIQKLVRHLTNRGIGVLITDHNVRETLDLTDRSYIIYSGAVLMEGDKEEVVNDPEVRRLYLGEDFRFS